MTKLGELITSMQSFKKEIQEKGEVLIKETFKELFDKHPRLVAVGWTQYAPFFNDGEPCEFRVNDLQYRLDDDKANERDDEDFLPSIEDEDLDSRIDRYLPHSAYSSFDDEYRRKEIYNKEIHNDVHVVSKQFGEIEDILRGVFGYDNSILVTRNKIHVMDYSGSHD
jgi:hypothetical protein